MQRKMQENEENPNKCHRKALLSLFFVLELLAFTFSLIAVVSPSWQYAFLEVINFHFLILILIISMEKENKLKREYYK